jgi:hypothetical protein
MNKNLIRVLATIILLSPWIYIGSTLKEIMCVIFSIVILLATVDIAKKKKADVI